MPWGDEIIVWVLLLAAVITDLRSGKIYNVLTLPFVFLGIVYRSYVGGPDDFTLALYGVGTAFLLFFPLYIVRVFGAGDVKLLMAVGAWTTSAFVIQLGLTAVVLGAVIGALVLLRNKGFKGFLESLAAQLKPGTAKALHIPFAPAFLCAFLYMKIAEVYQW